MNKNVILIISHKDANLNCFSLNPRTYNLDSKNFYMVIQQKQIHIQNEIYANTFGISRLGKL